MTREKKRKPAQDSEDAGLAASGADAELVTDRDTAGSTLMNGDLMVVGIGASAGGLEALRELVTNLPIRSRMTYVVAQHLSPTHRSMLMELLSRETSLSVQNLNRPVRPRANTIYITPPNRDVELVNGALRLRPPLLAVGPKPSIDRFFTSLANSCGENAVAIILSGTGSDGAIGIRAVKAAGGITMAQTVSNARFPGMPQAAIDTGCIDLVLTAEEIGQRLNTIVEMPRGLNIPGDAVLESDSFLQVISILRGVTNIDLGEYRHGTLRRRIHRRMTLLGITDIAEYCERLRGDETEARQLVRDAFINVTGFFRDTSAFEAMEEAIAALIRQKPGDQPIRAWVAGCSSGEEAYSVAMLLDEAVRAAGTHHRIQVFATDIVAELTDKGRQGIYPASAVADLGEARLSRYFTPAGANFQISKELRRLVLFAKHNLIEDPPFSKLDLVCCRNVLIYFSPLLQRRALSIFAYSLIQNGLLFLGKSETPTGNQEAFSTVDRSAKIFQLRPNKNRSLPPALPHSRITRPSMALPDLKREEPPENRILNLLMQTYIPASVMIDNSGRVLHFVGDLSGFLRLPQGPANLSVYDMVDAERRIELRAMLHRCQREGGAISGDIFTRDQGEQRSFYRMTIRPLPSADSHPDASLYVLSFDTVALTRAEGGGGDAGDLDSTQRIVELEHELVSNREHLQTVVEELEASNEELQSLNEELMSANEELQSSNEELETANEELQSTNEELITVNEELNTKTSALETAYMDLENIQSCLDFPLLVVDRKLRLTRFGNSCESIFPLASVSIGTNIATLPWRIDLPDLRGKLTEVISTGQQIEENVSDGDAIYRMRIAPYRDQGRSNNGAVISFLNITAVASMQTRLQQSLAMMGAIMEHIPAAVHVKDSEGRYLMVNREYERRYGVAAAVLIGRKSEEVFTGSIGALFRDQTNQVLGEGRQQMFESEVRFGDRTRHIRWIRFPVLGAGGELIGIGGLSTEIDDGGNPVTSP